MYRIKKVVDTVDSYNWVIRTFSAILKLRQKDEIKLKTIVK